MNPPSGFLRRTATRTFRDRHEAGRALAEDLASYRGKDNVLVLGLARGGVPVAWEIATALVRRWMCSWSASWACRAGPSSRWARWPAAASSR